MSEHLEEHHHCLGGVRVVLHDEHPGTTMALRFLLSHRRGGLIVRRWKSRQSHDELGALPEAVTPGLDAAVMKFDELPHHGESDPQTTMWPIESSFRLREQIEDVGQRLR